MTFEEAMALATKCVSHEHAKEYERVVRQELKRYGIPVHGVWHYFPPTSCGIHISEVDE